MLKLPEFTLNITDTRRTINNTLKVDYELKYWAKCTLVFGVSLCGLVLVAVILDPIVKKM